MKIAGIILAVVLAMGCSDEPKKHTACTGAAGCTICTNCSRCKHCKKPGNVACGVKKAKERANGR